MDLDFLERAEIRVSFNLEEKDFKTLTNKNEIQYLFNRHWFPEFNLKNTVSVVNKTKLNKITQELKFNYNNNFGYMHKLNPNGQIGPGEISLYFMVNSAVLGGGSSNGIDLIDNSGQYELKAIDVRGGKYASNLRMGVTADMNRTKQRMDDLRGNLYLDGHINKISTTTLRKMKELAPKEYKDIEEEFQENASKYFCHKTIFMNNGGQNKSRKGLIEEIKFIKKNEIFIEKIGKEIHPLVRIKYDG